MNIWTVYIVERYANGRIKEDEKVLVGPYSSEKDATDAKKRMVDKGFATEENVVIEKSYHRTDEDHTGGTIPWEDRPRLEEYEIVEERIDPDTGVRRYRTRTKRRPTEEGNGPS